MLSLNIHSHSLFTRKSNTELTTPNRFIQTPLDLARALFDKVGTPYGIALDRPAPNVGAHEILAMLNTISDWMEDSPGLRNDVRLALLAIIKEMKLKPDDDADGLKDRMKAIIDTCKPENFHTIQAFAAENIAAFLEKSERPALYSLNRATGIKLKHARALDLAATARDAVGCTRNLAKWLSNVEHLDEKRCRAQLLGIAAIASNTVPYRVGVEHMLEQALGKLAHEAQEQVIAAGYLESVEKATANRFAVADWNDQWDVALQLDADFRSGPLNWLTEPVIRSRVGKERYTGKIDAAIQQLQHLPVRQGAEAINALFFALQHFEDDPAVCSRLRCLENAYGCLPKHLRGTALPGYANSILMVLESRGALVAWVEGTSSNYFDNVLDLASEVKNKDNLESILEALAVSILFVDDRSKQKVAFILQLSTSLSSACRAYLLMRIAKGMYLNGKAALGETCFKACVDELARITDGTTEELGRMTWCCAKFLTALHPSQQDILYSKLPSFAPIVKAHLFQYCFLGLLKIPSTNLRLMMRHLPELKSYWRVPIVDELANTDSNEDGVFMASHDFLDYFSALPRDGQIIASENIGALLRSRVRPTLSAGKQMLHLCVLIAEYLVRRPETAPSFDAFAFSILGETRRSSFGGKYRSELKDVLANALERIPKDRRKEFSYRNSIWG